MFRLRRSAGDDRSPYGRFWFEPTSARSSSGVRVNSESAMRLAAVYACVTLLAKTFAVLPFGLNKPKKGGGNVPQPNHWLYKLIAKRPNQFQDPFMWRQMCMGHLSLRGNAYNQIFANRKGEVTDLLPMHPDRTKIDQFINGDYRYRYKQLDGTDLLLPRGQVWHMRGLSSDGITGLSPLAQAREAIGRGLAAQTYGAQYFSNAGGPTGGWIELPGQFKDQATRDEFTEAWQNARTGENRHKTPVLDKGMKYHELGIKNDEAQFLDTMQFSVTDICRFFGVPPHMVADLTQSTNNNIEQQSLEYRLFTMFPISTAWKYSISYNFLEDEDNLEPDFDLDELNRADSTARGNFYKTMFGIGAYSPNRILQNENEDPFEGGDQRFIPVNMTVLTPDMQPSTATPGMPPEGDSESQDAPTPAPKKKKAAESDRAMQLASAAAERLARRELGVITRAMKAGTGAVAEAYVDHARFVADALAVSIEQAGAYCEQRRTQIRPDQTNDDFELLARCSLERLALEGEA